MLDMRDASERASLELVPGSVHSLPTGGWSWASSSRARKLHVRACAAR